MKVVFNDESGQLKLEVFEDGTVKLKGKSIITTRERWLAKYIDDERCILGFKYQKD